MFSVLKVLIKSPAFVAGLVGVDLSFFDAQVFRFAPALGFAILVRIVFIATVKFVVVAFQLPCKQQRHAVTSSCNVDFDVRIATFCPFLDNAVSNRSFRELCFIPSTMRQS